MMKTQSISQGLWALKLLERYCRREMLFLISFQSLCLISTVMQSLEMPMLTP